MQHTMMDWPLTLTTILNRAARPFTATEIVSSLPDGSLRRMFYGDLHERALALAAALRRAGLRRGDRVATLMWNHDDHLTAYFGVPCAGGVLHTLNLRLHPDDLAYIVNHAEDRFLLVDDVLLPVLSKFLGRVKFERIIVTSQNAQAVPDGFESFDRFIEGPVSTDTESALPVVHEDDACGMCYTSGTTGRPKGVVYSHRSTVLHSLGVAMADGMGLSLGDAVLTVVPQFHANAWGVPYAATMVGAKQIFPGPNLDPISLLDLMAREDVTVGVGVPSVWSAVLEELERSTRWRLSPDLRLVVGGSAVPEAMIRAFDRHRVRVVHAWGMTETSPLGTVSHLRPSVGCDPDTQYATRAKQGMAVPFVEIRIAGEDGSEAPWDGKCTGELEVRGPWVAARYHNEVQGRWSPDGWFRTGDVATIDPDGYVKICDRTKDLIKSGGEWISSVFLENALAAHPAVREACVVGVPHPRWVERPLAVVVLRDGADATAGELLAFLGDKFAKWWVPDGVEFVQAIPRTSTGKFQKSALRERYKEWRPGG
jgi:fatty-acyl-CoA synthase